MYFGITAHSRVYSIGYDAANAYFPRRTEKKKKRKTKL